MSYPLLLSKYLNIPLLASPDLVHNAVTLLLSNKTTPTALSKKEGQTFKDLFEVRDDIGILNITGPIFRYGKIEACDIVYGTQHFSQILSMFEKDDKIKTIVINFDTGGGEATGISEFADQIRACPKRTVAYIDGTGASAGYWLASACDEIVANKTAYLGSIGVVFAYMDTTKMDENIGIEMIEIVSTVSPDKRIDPKEPKGRAKVQVWADDLATIFVDSIASFRNVTAEYVKENFGKGDVMIAQKALDAKMIDSIGNFEDLIINLKGEDKEMANELNESTPPSTSSAMSAEEFKKANPTAYSEIFNAGVSSETARIKSVFALADSNYMNVIEPLMFDGKSDSRDVKIALFDAKEEFFKSKKVSFERGGKHVADALANISTTHIGMNEISESKTKVDSSTEKAIAKAKAKRGKK